MSIHMVCVCARAPARAPVTGRWKSLIYEQCASDTYT